MRVLIVFSSSSIGGAERSLTKMALVDNFAAYSLGTLSVEGEWSSWARQCGAEPLIFSSSKRYFFLSKLFPYYNLLKYVLFEKPNVIYVCGLKASIFLRFLRPLFFKTKIVHAVRANPSSDSFFDRIFRWTEKVLAPSTSHWITNSLAAKETLVKKCSIKSEKVDVVYNGIEVSDCNQNKKKKNVPQVLLIANLSPRKGHLEFLQIIKDIIIEVPQTQFVFIGKDNMNGLVQKEIRKLKLEKNVFYEGFHENVTNFLSDSTLCVLPSLWGEGCPTSILESFSNSTPVVAYSIDGIPELISHGEDGFVASQGSDEMKTYILELLRNRPLAKVMGLRGRGKIMAKFRMQECSEKHFKIFQKLVSN